MFPNWIIYIVATASGLFLGLGANTWAAAFSRRTATFVALAGLLLFAVSAWMYLRNERESARRSAEAHVDTGALVPASDSIPGVAPGKSALTADETVLQLGGGANVYLRPGQKVVALRAGGEDIVSLNIRDDELWVAADVRDANGRRVARILGNRFRSYEGAFYARQPDPSTLIVMDDSGNEALSIRFVNRRAVRMTGRFYTPHGLVLIDDSGITAGGVRMSGNTMRNVGTAIQLGP